MQQEVRGAASAPQHHHHHHQQQQQPQSSMVQPQPQPANIQVPAGPGAPLLPWFAAEQAMLPGAMAPGCMPAGSMSGLSDFAGGPPLAPAPTPGAFSNGGLPEGMLGAPSSAFDPMAAWYTQQQTAQAQLPLQQLPPFLGHLPGTPGGGGACAADPVSGWSPSGPLQLHAASSAAFGLPLWQQPTLGGAPEGALSRMPSFAGSPWGPEVERMSFGAMWPGVHPFPPTSASSSACRLDHH